MVSTQKEFRDRFRENAEKRNSRLILALDEPKFERVQDVVSKVSKHLAAIKIHPEYPLKWLDSHTAANAIIATRTDGMLPLIMDAKLADIDNSNKMKAEFYFSKEYDAIICHGFPGQKAVEAVIKVANEQGKGVFLLTAMTSPGHMFDSWTIEKLARMAKELDVAGVIAPGNQYSILRKVRRIIGPEILILSPGIGVQGGDAEKAFVAGTDFAIIGRQFLEAEDPENVAAEIKSMMNSAVDRKKRAEIENTGMARYEDLFAALAEQEVLKFGDFKLKSGRPSAYFFNAGDICDGKAMSAAAEAYADLIYDNKLNEKYDLLFGPAYKGISIAAYVATLLWLKYRINMRAAYDRKEEKTHGDATAGGAKEKMIVGKIKQGDRVLIMDDVITTGGAKVEAKEKLDSLGKDLKINGILILFDRQETDMEGKDPLENFRSQGIDTYVVLKAREVFDYLKNREIGGKVLVTDNLYNAFQQHQKEFGRK